MEERHIGRFFKTLLLSLAALFFSTCGLEDYPYIYPVPQSSITTELNYQATVRVSNNNVDTAFTHLMIFYRIYVSNRSEQSPGPVNFSSINPVLGQDYSSVSPYIDSDTLVNTNMDSLFSGRGYKYLYLLEDDIDSVLSAPSVLRSTLIFDFPTSQFPTMTKIDSAGNTSVYTLWRSNGDGKFNPQPNRTFVNNDDLWKNEYLNSQFNADVVNYPGITDGDPSHNTFAAMFVVAAGINPDTYSYIYSTPSLIHVFQLPDPWQQ